MVAAAFIFKENPILSPFKLLSIPMLIVPTYSLSYYAFQQRNYMFIVGAIMNFMIANAIVVLHLATGWIAFGWSRLFMAVVTDRIAVSGKVLMVLAVTSCRN